jgi:hypothetical protein
MFGKNSLVADPLVEFSHFFATFLGFSLFLEVLFHFLEICCSICDVRAQRDVETRIKDNYSSGTGGGGWHEERRREHTRAKNKVQ